MKKLKIAFLNKYQGKVNRGAETFVKEMSLRLSETHQVDVISDINYWKIFKSGYDLIIPTNGRFQVVWVRLLTWLTGSKMIVSGQSGKGWDDRVNLYAFPDYFIPISTFALNWARKINPLVRSVYIPNGVDVKKFKPEGKSLKINLEKPIVLCVGALNKEKRIDLTIKAVARMNNASLLVVGRGEQENSLRELGHKLMGKRFEIASFPYERMPEIYRVADIFTLVSEPFHSFENVLVEGMATNLPVVANNDAIRREIVGNAGILVDPTNTSAYTEALERALKADWGDKPENQARKFNWDEIAQKYLALIETL